MIPYRSTPVPNIIFDQYLPILKPTEVALLFVIIRQTIGWINPDTKRRKQTDWITGYQLRQKTGYSRRAISSALDSLTQNGLIKIYDGGGRELNTPEERKGKMRLLYAFHTPLYAIAGENRPTCAKSAQDMRKFCAQQKKLLQKKMTACMIHD